MSAFKRFGPGDQIDNVLVLEPQWTLASGTSGWKGSPEGSASVSLYGGYNRQPNGVVREYRFQRTIQGTDSFGVLARSEPITASVNYVWMTNESLDLSQRSNVRWGYEHWKTVTGLFEYYNRRNPDYNTASYDHYCLFFNSGSTNIVNVYDKQSAVPNYYSAIPTGSFTIEAWFKPLATSSLGSTFTIMQRARAFRLYIDGNNGNLMFAVHSGTATANTYVTSSVAVTPGRWHHAAVTFDYSTLSGTMYVDLQQASTFTLPGPIRWPINYTGSLHIGGEYGGSINTLGSTNKENPASSVSTARTGFHGFIGETRIWSTNLSYTRLSSSYDTRLTGSALLAPLMSNARLSDGPLMISSPTADPAGTIFNYSGGGLMGSGVLDYAAHARSEWVDFGVLYNFSRSGPVWHPNDNPNFYVQKSPVQTRVTGAYWSSDGGSVQRMRVFSIPSGFFGRGIVPNSVKITDQTWSDPRVGLVRTLVDDGRGGLYLSGSTTGSTETVSWNKVGNVFYSEGLIVIKDPAMLDFGEPVDALTTSPSDIVQLDFRGQSRVPVKTLMCRIDRGDLNASLNPTFYRTEEDGDRVRRHPSGSLYVTTVGIYNSDRELVGVARLAEPLRVRPRDRMNIKLRMDF